MRLLILDRDGVINEDSTDFIKTPDEWTAIPGSLESIARANQAGYRVVVVSNQSGLARGLFDMGMLNKIHTRMVTEVSRYGGRIEAVFYCPHGPDDGCECRKPRPGLLLDIGRRLNTELSEATMIGDRMSDMTAADAVGARKILVKTGHGRETAASLGADSGVTVCEDLADAVDVLTR